MRRSIMPTRRAYDVGVVDGHGSDDPTAFEAEAQRTARSPSVPRTTVVVGTGQGADDLDVHAVPVGPEPGGSLCRDRRAQDRRGGARAVVLGGLPVFGALATATRPTLRRAGSPTARTAGFDVVWTGVDDDAPVHLETGRLGQGGVGYHPNAEDDRVERLRLGAVEHGRDPAGGLLEACDPCLQRP